MNDIETLLEKLEPLIPKKVAKWRAILEVAKPELEQLLKTHIKLIARQHLGENYQKKLLLSLPPEKIAQGSFQLGTIIYEQPKWSFGISAKEINEHIGIYGRSGAGKTNVAYILLQQLLQKNINVLYFDWKRTARSMIPLVGKKLQVYTPGRTVSPFPFNPFIIPPGVEWKIYVNHIIDVIGDSHTIGDGAKSILHDIFSSFYEQNKIPTMKDALEALKALKTEGRATGWKTTAMKALKSLAFIEAETTPHEQAAFTKSLIQQNTILELDTLPQSVKKFLIPMICFSLYSLQLAKQEREKLKLVIFLEEAHKTNFRSDNRSKESLMNSLFRTSREIGISYCLIDQHPHLISSAALGNCFCKIFLDLVDPTDINKAAGIAMLNEKEKKHLSYLPKGMGIVKLQNRWQHPFLIKIPLMPIDKEKGIMTDAVLKKFMAGEITLSDLRKRANISPLHTEQVRTHENEFTVGGLRVRFTDITENSLRLLHDVIQYPNDGVRKRYQRLQVSVDKGNQWKQALLDQKYVTAERVKIGRAYRVLLHPTKAGKNLVTPTKEGRDGRAGFEHEYYKQLNANKLTQAGFKTALEVPRKKRPGRMDLIASGLSQPKLCIEIETGKSDVVSNVKHDLAEGYKKIIVVVTDKRVLEKVTQQLDNAGLLIPPRVVVVLKDELGTTFDFVEPKE